MKKTIAILTIMATLLFLLQSCIKTKNKYTMIGRIMSYNTNLPVDSLHLILYAPPVGYHGGFGRELGNTYTDSNGNFIISDIKVTDNSQLEFAGNFIPKISLGHVPTNGDTVDRGDIYVNR